MLSEAVCFEVGTLIAQWLFWQTKTTGALNTPAKFIATWKSPSDVAPSPMYAATTVRSPRIFAAMAAPTACGSWVPMQLDQLTWFTLREEDPVGRLERDGGGERSRLLAGAGAVEADPALALQGHHALVQRPQPHHLPVEPQEQLRRGPRPGIAQRFRRPHHPTSASSSSGAS